MCVVSMVGDSFRDRWEPRMPTWYPDKPVVPGTFPQQLNPPQITREEFDALKREVELLKDLLKRAKAYDEANNEPDCELEEKIALLKAIAKAVGVDLDDVLGK